MKPEEARGAAGDGDSWRRRVVYGAAVAVVATIGYRTVQGVTAGQAVARSDCWSWRQVPFSTWWLLPYCSMFAIMALPWFCLQRERLRRFASTVLGMAAVAWTIFLLHPTACVRPEVGVEHFAYRLLVLLDGPNNCLPCLHAAMPVVAVAALAGSGGRWSRPCGRWLLVGWLGLIAVSILGVRQHTGVDVAVGLALGLGAAWIAQRVTCQSRMEGAGVSTKKAAP